MMGRLNRVFVSAGFVITKQSPKDLDILLIMNADFETEHIDSQTQTIFDSTRAKLQFEADVFWARESIGGEILRMWLDTYQISRSFRKRGIVELELP